MTPTVPIPCRNKTHLLSVYFDPVKNLSAASRWQEVFLDFEHGIHYFIHQMMEKNVGIF
jgi:hypothetical protein